MAVAAERVRDAPCSPLAVRCSVATDRAWIARESMAAGVTGEAAGEAMRPSSLGASKVRATGAACSRCAAPQSRTRGGEQRKRCARSD